jgi:hypothetical protein
VHSSRLAERLLSLVIPQAHAAAVVGDFAESSPGEAQFWWSVLRTGCSLLWAGVAANPARMATLAAGGAVIQFVYSGFLLMCVFAIAATLGFLKSWLNLEASWLLAAIFGLPIFGLPIFGLPIFGLMVLCVAIPSPFLAGRWLARRAPGHELTPCLALTMLTGILWGIGFLI